MSIHRPISAHTKPIRELHRSLSGRNTETTKVFVCSTLVSGGFVYRTILWDGEYYLLNHHQYAAIQRGETPESLGLEPSTNDTDD